MHHSRPSASVLGPYPLIVPCSHAVRDQFQYHCIASDKFCLGAFEQLNSMRVLSFHLEEIKWNRDHSMWRNCTLINIKSIDEIAVELMSRVDIDIRLPG